jgi:hypothetical protein
MDRAGDEGRRAVKNRRDVRIAIGMIFGVLLCAVMGVTLTPCVGQAAEIHPWPLNETSGTTADNTIGADGTYTRDASNTTTAGPNAGIPLGQDFVPASSDYVDISAASISFSSTTAWSYGVWFKADTTGNIAILGRSDNGTSSIRKFSDTEFRVFGSLSGPFSFTVAATGTTNWHFLLVTHATDGTTRCFVDAVEAGATQDIDQTFAPTFIGRVSTVTSWDGKLAWARFWNTDESANVAARYAERLVASGLLKSLLLHGSLTPSKHRRTPSGNYEVWSFAQR